MKMFLHPGFYFAGIWVIAVPSQWYLTIEEIAYIPYPEYVDELNIFVSFTALCFIIFANFGTKTKKQNGAELSFLRSKRFYSFLLYLTLTGALLRLFKSWYFIGINFNIGQVRLAITGDLNQLQQGSSLIDSLSSYMNIFYPIITILAGYYLGLKVQRKTGFINSNWLIFIPFLITIIYVMTIGGRNPLAIGLKLYILGFAFTLQYQVLDRVKKKIWIYFIAAFLAFGLFSTLVGNQREQLAKGYTFSGGFSDNINSKVLKNFSGIMEYMGAHYSGYQIRRHDTFDPNKLGYGYYTFNGLFNFSVPFSSLVGLRGTLGDFFGFEENELKYSRLAELDKPSFWTTRSVYLEMICDFGVYGIFGFIFLITFYTHRIFLKLTKRRFNKALNFIFFYLIFTYWSSSNFQSNYSNNLLVVFLGFWGFDFLQKHVFRTPLNRSGHKSSTYNNEHTKSEQVYS
jgi:oligosaccharide repeat unit polymerase